MWTGAKCLACRHQLEKLCGRRHRIECVGVVCPSRHLVSRSSGMSDSERDQIDSEAEEFIRMCSERIRTLQQNGTPKTACCI